MGRGGAFGLLMMEFQALSVMVFQIRRQQLLATGRIILAHGSYHCWLAVMNGAVVDI